MKTLGCPFSMREFEASVTRGGHMLADALRSGANISLRLTLRLRKSNQATLKKKVLGKAPGAVFRSATLISAQWLWSGVGPARRGWPFLSCCTNQSEAPLPKGQQQAAHYLSQPNCPVEHLNIPTKNIIFISILFKILIM